MPPAQAKPQKDVQNVAEKAETNALVEPGLAKEESIAQGERGESDKVAPEVVAASKRLLSSTPPGVEEKEEEERAMRGPQIPDRLKEALQKEAEESSEQAAQPSEPEPEPKEKRGRQVNWETYSVDAPTFQVYADFYLKYISPTGKTEVGRGRSTRRTAAVKARPRRT